MAECDVTDIYKNPLVYWAMTVNMHKKHGLSTKFFLLRIILYIMSPKSHHFTNIPVKNTS